MFLVDFLLYVTPGGAGIFFLMRWVKGKALVSGLRLDAARSDAQLDAAREAAEAAQGTSEQQRVLLGDALQVAKRVEHVDEIVTGLADFLSSRVAWRPGDAPALPGAPGRPSVTAGDQEEGWS
jgi:hypothetical protein